MGNVEEIKELIKNDIVKEKTVSTLASKYDISELEVIGIIKKLKDDGVNISYYEKNQDAYVIINDHPDFSKENSYYIKEDINGNTKIAFIADTRFGSKKEQIAILNDMYKEFAKEGVKYVILAGNLLEGPYKGNDALEFGESFEAKFLNQGKFENRTIQQTLDIALEVLSILPPEELDKI